MARKLDLIFSKRFKYNIWKIHAFKESSLLVLEIRNQEVLQVSFFVIEELGRISDEIILDESWWISVAQLVDQKIIFYTFDADNNPEVKGYITYDLRTEKIAQEDKGFSLQEDLISNQNNTLEIPFHYPAGSDYFNTVSGFIKSKFDDNCVKGVDYFEKEGLIFMSYFKEEGKHLINRLLVINSSQEIMLNEKLGDFDKGITDNTFFLFNNKLIFVKGVSEIFIYQL